MDVDRADVPKDLRWALDCPYDDIDFDNFKHFAALGKHIKSRDQCMGIHGYMWTIQDVNHDFDVDKCEHMYGCITYFHKEGQSEEQDYKNGDMCAKGVNKYYKENPDMDKFTLKQVGEICAMQYPSLKGTPLPHDD